MVDDDHSDDKQLVADTLHLFRHYLPTLLLGAYDYMRAVKEGLYRRERQAARSTDSAQLVK